MHMHVFPPGLFWSAHQRFFRSLCIASKVDKAVSLAKSALKDGHCCVIGLQSTGEARAKGAARVAGFDANSGGEFDDYISAPNEDLKRIIMMMFPLPPKPKGVIAPVFLNPLKKDVDKSTVEDSSVAPEELQGKRTRRSTRNAVVTVEDDDEEDDDNDDTEFDDESYEDDAHEDEDEDEDMVGSEEYDDDTKTNETGGKRKSREDRSIAQKKQKTSVSGRVGKRIPWDEIPLDLDVTKSAENERLVTYRKAVDRLKHYMEAVDKLELPPNPLDR